MVSEISADSSSPLSLTDEALVSDLIGRLFGMPLEDAKEFLQVHIRRFNPQQMERIHTALFALPLICRFKEENRGEAAAIYAASKYTESQIEYGKKWFQSALLIEKTSSLTDKFMSWALDREEIAIQRGEDSSADFTLPRNASRSEKYTSIVGRYSWILDSYPEQALQNLALLGDGASEISYVLQYPDSSGRNLPLTRFVNEPGATPHWQHTSRKVLRILEPHLNELHEELHALGKEMVAAQGTDAFESKKGPFLAKLAEVYWLASNLMLTARGSAQYCQNLLFHELVDHKLPPLVPKVGLLPDCIAITIPLEVFQKNFLSYFESMDTFAQIRELCTSK
ncbi:MAG TPA: hypothetical protein VLF94_03045 [Chlamydiales bacterium]|nr:hypothetical protein [Chlamydiales bacterium]